MSSSILTAIKNCAIWFILLIFLTVPILLLKLWKTFVIILARILRPSLKPFQTRDSMVLGDNIYEKPMINIGVVLKVNGEVNAADFRLHFYKTLLEPVDIRTGERLNKNLLRFHKRFWGYGFKQSIKLRDIDLEDLIYESALRKGETFSDFTNRFFYAPYQEEKPLWNIVLLHGVDPGKCRQEQSDSNGTTTVLFRLHHSMGDGISLIYLFEQLAGGVHTQKKASPTIFNETLWDKICLCVSTPLTMIEFGKKISQIPNPFPMSGSNTQIFYKFFTIELETIKRIRHKTGVHVLTILFTLLGGVLRKLLIEQQSGDTNLPSHIGVTSSLSWPHPKDKMCNEWTVGIFKIPIKNSNVINRLQETESELVDFHTRGLNKMLKVLLMPLMSLAPVPLLQKSAGQKTNIATSWSAILAGSNYKLLGHSVLNIWPFVGFTTPKMTAVTVSLTHSDKMDVTLAMNREFVRDASMISRITDEFFPKELESLLSDTEDL